MCVLFHFAVQDRIISPEVREPALGPVPFKAYLGLFKRSIQFGTIPGVTGPLRFCEVPWMGEFTLEDRWGHTCWGIVTTPVHSFYRHVLIHTC